MCVWSATQSSPTARREKAIRQALRETEERLRRAGKAVPAPVPDGFSFFTIDAEGRRRITDLPAAAARIESGQAWPSADVITRPVLKSYLLPMAVSILGPAEIAYHAQSLPLFSLFGIPRPVLIPRGIHDGPPLFRSQQPGIRPRSL